jgi:inorganic pyrophosphatase
MILSNSKENDMTFPQPFFRWRPHPWHGIDIGPNPPKVVHAYIEITSFDLVKYEVDKVTGYLQADRPQRSSSQPPTLYGFIPRTYCGERVGKLSKTHKVGDGDPLDICVICERPITKSEIVVNARVIGVLRMVDHNAADDKIISILDNDPFWANANDIGDVPAVLIERLRHYFSTYKLIPGEEAQTYIEDVCGVEEATKIIQASIDDYNQMFG